MRDLIERVTGIPFDNGYRWLYPYIFISFVVMVLSVVTLLGTVNAEPRVFYDQLNLPDDVSFCPGETLDWSVDIRVRGGNIERLEIVRTIWSVDEARTVVFDDHPEFSVIRGPQSTAFPRLSYLIPDLAAGNYELRVASSGHLTKVTGYFIPFTVPEGCSGG
jgi:hypothetical protein